MSLDRGPRVAVDMPAWNAERHIGEAIASLLAQRGAARFDIIVADDGSTDGTRALVQSIATTAPEVRLLVLPHRGISFARNAALEAMSADTEYVTFLDADDVSVAGRFARDLAILEAGSADLVWGRSRRFFDADASIGLAARPDAESLERGSQLGNLIMRADLVRRIGRFEESLPLAEDVDFLLRLIECEPRMYLSEEACVLYRRHSTNTTHRRSEAEASLKRAYALAARRRRGRRYATPDGLFEPAPDEQRP